MNSTAPPSPQSAANVGFTDAAGRWWPVAFTVARVELALALGIDLAQAMLTAEGPSRLLGNGDRASLVRIVQLACTAAGGDDIDPPGFVIAGNYMTPEAFATVMANVATFKGATVAILEALAAYFPGTPGSQSVVKARSRLRAERK